MVSSSPRAHSPFYRRNSAETPQNDTMLLEVCVSEIVITTAVSCKQRIVHERAALDNCACLVNLRTSITLLCAHIVIVCMFVLN